MSQLKKIILLLLTFSICSHAEKEVNPEIWFAHSVIVTAYDGAKTGNIYDSKIPLDERAIIGDIEDRFRKWGRYHVVTHLEDADIVILVKKASGIGIGIGGDRNCRKQGQVWIFLVLVISLPCIPDAGQTRLMGQ